jgi:hypothetical protein
MVVQMVVQKDVRKVVESDESMAVVRAVSSVAL